MCINSVLVINGRKLSQMSEVKFKGLGQMIDDDSVLLYLWKEKLSSFVFFLFISTIPPEENIEDQPPATGFLGSTYFFWLWHVT